MTRPLPEECRFLIEHWSDYSLMRASCLEMWDALPMPGWADDREPPDGGTRAQAVLVKNWQQFLQLREIETGSLVRWEYEVLLEVQGRLRDRVEAAGWYFEELDEEFDYHELPPLNLVFDYRLPKGLQSVREPRIVLDLVGRLPWHLEPDTYPVRIWETEPRPSEALVPSVTLDLDLSKVDEELQQAEAEAVLSRLHLPSSFYIRDPDVNELGAGRWGLCSALKPSIEACLKKSGYLADYLTGQLDELISAFGGSASPRKGR